MENIPSRVCFGDLEIDRSFRTAGSIKQHTIELFFFVYSSKFSSIEMMWLHITTPEFLEVVYHLLMTNQRTFTCYNASVFSYSVTHLTCFSSWSSCNIKDSISRLYIEKVYWYLGAHSLKIYLSVFIDRKLPKGRLYISIENKSSFWKRKFCKCYFSYIEAISYFCIITFDIIDSEACFSFLSLETIFENLEIWF